MEIATAVPGTLKEWRAPLPPEIAERYALPPGPWRDEPTKAQWVDAATGLPCLIVRNHIGALCGYAGVSRDHPLHGKPYVDLDVDVHGGLTFADGCQHSKDESQGVCHVPEPGTPDDVWWFGFDCAHCFDLIPGMPKFPEIEAMYPTPAHMQQVYRDADYVAGEVTRLAAQLQALGRKRRKRSVRDAFALEA